jgi:hypothetical protein
MRLALQRAIAPANAAAANHRGAIAAYELVTGRLLSLTGKSIVEHE